MPVGLGPPRQSEAATKCITPQRRTAATACGGCALKIEVVVSAMRNVLIPGTPRSGTTLLCSLLNKLPDTVALHEPMNVWDFPKCRDAGAVADVIESFCAENPTRSS